MMANQDSQTAAKPGDTNLDALAPIWAKLLGVKKVAPDDNFFAMGGHSLLAVKLIAAVQEKMNLGSELKLSDLFDHPTLGDFSRHLASLNAPGEEEGEI